MLIYIYITSIEFRGSPIVWEYDTDRDVATCQFRTMPLTNATADKPHIIEYLSKQKNKIKGLNIEIVKIERSDGLIEEETKITLSGIQEYLKDMKVVSAPRSAAIAASSDVKELMNSAPTLPTAVPSIDLRNITSITTRKQPAPKPEESISSTADTKTAIPLNHSQGLPSIKRFFEPVTNENAATGLEFEAVLPLTVETDLAGDTKRYQIGADNAAKIHHTAPDDTYVTQENCSYFRNKYELALKKSSIVFDSGPTFGSKITASLNGELLPVKEQQMEKLKHFFDNVLAPLYRKQRKQPPNQQLIKFFQQAIRGVMRNTPHNNEKIRELESDNTGLTYLEQSKEEMAKFTQKHQLKEAIHQEIFARARFHLRAFRFFITNDIKSSELTSDKRIQAKLESLKLALRTQRGLLAEACLILEELTELTGKSGRITTKYEFIKEEIERQQKQKVNLTFKSLVEVDYAEFDTIEIALLEEEKTKLVLDPTLKKLKKDLLVEGYSCHQFIKQFLSETLEWKRKKRESKKKGLIESLTNQIIAKTIGLIHDNLSFKDKRVPNLNDGMKDFYFSEKNLTLLHAHLSKLDLKRYEKKRHEEGLIDLCGDAIYTFITTKLLANTSKVIIEDPTLNERITRSNAEETVTPRRRANTDSNNNKNLPDNRFKLFRCASDLNDSTIETKKVQVNLSTSHRD